MPKQVRLQMNREVKLMREWVNSLDIIFEVGASQRQKIERIKQEMRDRMKEAFGVK